ncbi:MAG: LysM peptidoglycan-binding domain-containing protein [Flavobacteriales bacterium]|nr:LysM peptidoglycan-binding domain-containing protein [Flavobacteriales bacterium]MCB9204414.1 LysM peptidoglycan-binding domain-containing protein [Flavobacteriales bacterium]
MLRFNAILLAFFLFSGHVLLAQEMEVVKSDSVAKIEGQLYSIHVVQPKQTLFSIAKAYEVKLSRIAFDNPGVLDGLKLGQALKILKSAQGETKPVEVSNEALELDGEYVLYKVPKQQTLYAISKEYNTTVSAILDANPELSDGLKVGSTIRIPVPKMLGEKQTAKVEMVGLPDIIKNEVVRPTERVVVPGKMGRIALMLPLYLTENDTLEANRLPEQPEKVYERSEIGLAFYEGFLLALDTLKKRGFEADVTVIDTENRPWKMQQMIKKGELENYDLIIGPLYGKVFDEVSKYAYENCIPIVSPTLKNDQIVTSNDYALKLIPSEEAMVFSLGEYMFQSDSTNNIIVHYGAAGEENLIWNFRKGLEASGMKPAHFPIVDLSKTTRDSLRLRLSLTRRNNVVLLSTNEVKMASLMRGMSNWVEDAYIVTYAPNAWQGFKNVEMDYFDMFRVHVPTPFHVDYNNLEVQYFVQKYRQVYNSEPSTFAFRGYDLAYHLIQNLADINANGLDFLQQVVETGLQSNFRWKRTANGGLENSAPKIVDYTNYELKIATD